jgi:hypothetical protein
MEGEQILVFCTYEVIVFSSKVVEGCFGMVHWHINIRWQNSPGTSEAASLDAASVPEKKIQ